MLKAFGNLLWNDPIHYLCTHLIFSYEKLYYEKEINKLAFLTSYPFPFLFYTHVYRFHQCFCSEKIQICEKYRVKNEKKSMVSERNATGTGYVKDWEDTGKGVSTAPVNLFWLGG